MVGTYTRHGTSRAGDDYQDLWGAQILIELLEHPDRYEWVQFESDEAGFLDDIQALRSDGSYVLRQIKFTVDPEDDRYEVSWDFLLDQKNDKKGRPLPSLLQKWAKTVFVFSPKMRIFEAALYTNRQPNEDLKVVLDINGRINFAAISSPTRERISEQIGGPDLANEFFLKFSFQLDRPAPHTLEEGVRRRFFNLGGEYLGWYSLLSEIRSWAKLKNMPFPDGRITYRILREAARWYHLKELPQAFEIPLDYVVPSEDLHKNIVTTLKTRKNPCLVLWGSPGSGKSTYLSYLCDSLKKTNFPFVRHHYFLSLKDRSGDRFTHQVVAESIMQQIQTRYPKSLGSLSVQNPNPRDLGRWLEQCGLYFSKSGECLIVIIDGLDHVWRERKSVEEITHLFECLLPAPEGVVVLIGTQRLDPSQLAPRLLQNAPTNQWLRLPLLSVTAIRKWLGFRPDSIDLPAEAPGRDLVLNEQAHAFFEISQGHPLHLRYSFDFLVRQGRRMWKETILSLPPCPEGDIERYYLTLWNALETEGQEMLHLLASSEFLWPREGLIACLSSGSTMASDYLKAERQIGHLLSWNELGATAFHGSLLVFVKGRPDHEPCEQLLLPKVLTWLLEKAPGYWRWAYEWIIRAKLGDSEPLRDGPTLEWVREAIAISRPVQQVADIVQRASWEALDQKLLARVIELNTLWQYLINSAQFQEETFEMILFCQLRLLEDDYLFRRLISDLTKLSDAELVLVAEAGREQGNVKLPERCLNEFVRRLEEASEAGDFRDRNNQKDIKRNLELAAIAGTINVNRIMKFIIANRKDALAGDAFSIYSKRLAELRDVDTIRKVLELRLDFDDLYCVAINVFRLACEESFDLAAWEWTPEHHKIPLLLCYRAFCKNLDPPKTFILSPDLSILEQDEHQIIGKQPGIVRFFHDLFFSSLALDLCSQGQYMDIWLRKIPTTNWRYRCCHHLAGAAQNLAQRIRNGEIPSYAWIYEATNDLQPPGRYEDAVSGRFRKYIPEVLTEIALDLYFLGRLMGGSRFVSDAEFQKAVDSQYWVQDTWIEDYVERKITFLSDEAVEKLLTAEEERILKSINQLDERAAQYARLSQMCVLHGETFAERGKGFLGKAALCILGYGGHKDTLLFETLEIIEACQKAGVGPTGGWLRDIAPMIAAVNEFTDGDETRHLIKEFAGTIQAVEPSLFPVYYDHLCKNEEWENAEGSFSNFLQHTNLSDFIVRAIARTTIDEGGLAELKKRADAGEPEAQSIFTEQERVLGSITFKKDLNNKNEHPTAKSPPDPKGYPPQDLGKYIKVLKEGGFQYDSGSLVPWFDYWVNNGKGEDVLEVISSSWGSESNEFILERLLDRVFKLSLTLRGRSEAYPWLVRAHRLRYGWSKYWTQEGEAIQRFRTIAQFYPEKWLEFIKDGAVPKYAADRRGQIPVVGFDRLVKYCLICNQKEIAQELAETAIKVTLERTADLNIPTPSWVLEQPGWDDNLLKLLFLRLEWPSLMVRELAATQIVELFKDIRQRDLLMGFFTSWLSNCPLESLTANLLLIPLRLKVDGFCDIFHTTSLEENIRHPSILSHLPLSELENNWSMPKTWSEWHSGSPPTGFNPSPYFERHKTAFVPPIYDMHAKRIEKDYLIPFGRQWAYEWEHIKERSNLSESGQPYYFIPPGPDREHVYIDVPQSEVYRSAFLRALAWGVDGGALPTELARIFALESCPTDVGLWKIQLCVKPGWWPKAKPSPGPLDTVPPQIWSQVEKLWKSQPMERNCLLLQAAGPALITDTSIYDIEVYGFFQRFEGGEEPNLEEVIPHISSQYTLPNVIGAELRGQLYDEPVNKYVQIFSGWSVAPAAFRLRPHPTPRWKASWLHRGIWIPAPYLIETPNKLICTEAALELWSETRRIAFWQVWPDYLRERWYQNIPPGIGECLFIDAKRLKEFCETVKAAFCWAVRVTLHYRQYSYDRFKTYVDTRTFGTSSILR